MILWLNPVSGLSGDMLLAALVHLGAPLDEIRRAVGSTGLTGWQLDVSPRPGLAMPALQARVTVRDDTAHRRAGELLAMVEAATPRPVAELASRALTAIAEAEAAVHGEPAAEVHLHELGGHDTVVDLVGVAAALHLLGVDRVLSAPLALGTGTVRTRHGVLPAPAPATLTLLAGMTVRGCAVAGETVTPTGAALLRAAGCEFGEAPAMVLDGVGYGAGSRVQAGLPNVLVAMLGHPAAGPAAPREAMTVVETTVDDVSGELLGYTLQEMLALGAADAWISPVIGKKGRPAQVVSVLVSNDRADAVEARLLRETGSLGARRVAVARTALGRGTEWVEVDGARIRIKHGPHGRKPEYEDVAAAARSRGVPLRTVAEQALAAYDAALAERSPEVRSAAGPQ